MAKNQISFFATRLDLEGIVTAISTDQALHFAVAGLFDTETPQIVENLLNDPNFGLARSGNSVTENRYLVFDPQNAWIAVRAVPQKAGGTKFAVDQLNNPNTIVFQPGGQFGDAILISGQIGTVSEDPASVEFYKRVAKLIRSRFKRIQSFYVGQEAAERLNQGWRLTTNFKAPELYDLKH